LRSVFTSFEGLTCSICAQRKIGDSPVSPGRNFLLVSASLRIALEFAADIADRNADY
jgi:hypothetical protein